MLLMVHHKLKYNYNGKQVEAKLVGTDAVSDIAVLKLILKRN